MFGLLERNHFEVDVLSRSGVDTLKVCHVLLELRLADVFTSCLNFFINKPTFSKFVMLLLYDS